MSTKNGAKRHTHKYMKLPSQVWACGFGDCTHYLPSNMTAMIHGRQSICWECGDTMLLEEKQLKMDKPYCNNCILKFAEVNPVLIDAIAEIERKAKRDKAEVISQKEDDDTDGRLY
jgi:late competence protein required for DNA uptake (superfamily II DNA/RNA helicase)